jgi:hypothetical protein
VPHQTDHLATIDRDALDRTYREVDAINQDRKFRA